MVLRLLTLLLISLPLIIYSQEPDIDTLSNSKSGYLEKRKFRKPIDAARGVFYRFTYNPAFTGIENSFYAAQRRSRHNLNIGYYNNWPGLAINNGDSRFAAPSGYFTTYEVAFGKKRKSSLGANFLRNQNGYSKGWNTGLAYAFEMRFSRYSLLRLGLGLNYFQRSLVIENLSFGDMVGPRYGYVFETQEHPEASQIKYLDINVGTWLKLRDFQLGCSMISVTQPDMSFSGLSRKPVVVFLHGQYDWLVSRHTVISPYLQFKLSIINRLTPGITASFMEKYIVGVNLENMNVVRGLIGYELNKKYRLALTGGVPIEKEIRAMSYSAHVEASFRCLLNFKKKEKEVTNE